MLIVRRAWLFDDATQMQSQGAATDWLKGLGWWYDGKASLIVAERGSLWRSKQGDSGWSSEESKAKSVCVLDLVLVKAGSFPTEGDVCHEPFAVHPMSSPMTEERRGGWLLLIPVTTVWAWTGVSTRHDCNSRQWFLYFEYLRNRQDM